MSSIPGQEYLAPLNPFLKFTQSMQVWSPQFAESLRDRFQTAVDLGAQLKKWKGERDTTADCFAYMQAKNLLQFEVGRLKEVFEPKEESKVESDDEQEETVEISSYIRAFKGQILELHAFLSNQPKGF